MSELGDESMKEIVKKVIFGPADWFIYTVLSDEQRKAVANIFSDEQKEKIKKILFGKKQAQREKLKRIKYHLYNLGFTEKGLADLKNYFETMSDYQLKRLAAWELTLWYANQNTVEGAREALKYVEAAKNRERDENQLRRIAIVEAECYEAIGEREKGKQVIHELLQKQTHGDLYLAAANLEENMDSRLTWINRAMEKYGLQPIYFLNMENPNYDDLRTKDIDRKIEDGPKVSVIIPAYKAEVGIQVAIESILSQTWQNIELIVVDDCSPDDTAKVVQQYVDKDPRVKLFSTPVNSGPYVARNIGLQHATGEFVTINDADDWSHAEKIEKQATHLIENKHVIANTSSHARLTEQLTFYRRGTPGKYLFPNMSSIMFRREPVLEKIGYWDSVRFAADGEFKRRLLRAFGEKSYVDLETGPLSLPRQSVTSLTASSAFGYNGFFMGVRREYVEAMEQYYREGNSLYYPYPMEKRPFQVPEPMWPQRVVNEDGTRQFHIVIATDFRVISDELLSIVKKAAQSNQSVGLVSLCQYMVEPLTIRSEIRELINDAKAQLLVYGEKIKTNKLFIFDGKTLAEWQRYVPQVDAEKTFVVLTEKHPIDDLEKFAHNLQKYFSNNATWHAINKDIAEQYEDINKEFVLEQVFHESWVYDER